MGKRYNDEHINMAKHYWIVEKLSAIEIGAKMGVPARTVSRWAATGNWTKLRVSITASRHEQLLKMHEQLIDLNNLISSRDEHYRFPNKEESLTIQRLSSAIKKLEMEKADLPTIISVLTQTLNWVRTFDVTKAKELSDIFDAFIQDQLK